MNYLTSGQLNTSKVSSIWKIVQSADSYWSPLEMSYTMCTVGHFQMRVCHTWTPLPPPSLLALPLRYGKALPSIYSRADSEKPILGVDQFRVIHALCSEILGSYSTASTVSEDDFLVLFLHALSSTTGSPTEGALGSFTRRKLRNLESWPIWKGAVGQKLDDFVGLEMYSEHCSPHPPWCHCVLCQHWMYKIKSDGTHRAQNCCDSSKRATPALHHLSSTYTRLVLSTLVCADSWPSQPLLSTCRSLLVMPVMSTLAPLHPASLLMS